MKAGRFLPLFLALVLTAAVASSAVSFSPREERENEFGDDIPEEHGFRWVGVNGFQQQGHRLRGVNRPRWGQHQDRYPGLGEGAPAARRVGRLLFEHCCPYRDRLRSQSQQEPTPTRLRAAGGKVVTDQQQPAPAAPAAGGLHGAGVAKVLLADRLLDIPLYDVSPGEMYFTSLEDYFRQPRPGLPYRSSQEYGARLAGVIVKYQAEAERAARVLGTAVHVIPNGVPLGAWCSRSSRPMGERLVMGTLARISPQKKLEQLLAALRRAQGRLPPHVLRIGGATERGGTAYAEELRRLADGLPVEWVGEVETPHPFLRELDLFAMVSEPAGCPNALMEAMAEGLPVAATDVGGAAEQVQDGVTGRVVPRGDVCALAEALVELARDPARRMQWGAAGRARAEERFAQERMVSEYRRICLRSAPAAAARGYLLHPPNWQRISAGSPR